MSERVKLKDAALEIGMDEQSLRVYMKKGLIDIGCTFPSVRGKATRYFIFRDKLDKFLGKERTCEEP